MPTSPEPNREIGVSGGPLLVQMGGSCKGVFLHLAWAAVARKPLRGAPARAAVPSAGAPRVSVSGVSQFLDSCGQIAARTRQGALAKLYRLYQTLYT